MRLVASSSLDFDTYLESGSILVKTLLSEVKSSAVCARRTICFPQISSCFTKSEPEPRYVSNYSHFRLQVD